MIKHEIRWEYILVICIILGTLPCNAQSVIPMPKEMVMGEGSWDVSADTRINYSNDALTKTVSLFNNYLDGRFGVTLKKGWKECHSFADRQENAFRGIFISCG